MDSIVVSPKELLVLSSKVGSKRFFGIQDPFRGMTRNEIKSELPTIQLRLEKKGLVSLGFDDSFTLTPLCNSIIPICGFCEKYIALDSIVAGTVQPRALLYFRNTEIVSLYESDKGLEIKKVSIDDAIKFMLSSGFENCVNTKEAITSVKIAQSLLAEVRGLEVQEGVNTLSRAGIASSIAQALVMGLHQECGYSSLSAVDLKNRTFNSVICVMTQDGNLRLNPTEDNDTWQAIWVSKDEIHSEIESIIKGYCTS